jgi:hypothetical protein
MARLKIAAVIGFAVCFGLTLTSAHPVYAAPPTDACALVTPAQVSAVLGVTVGPGEHVFPSSTTLCGFGSAGAAKRVVVAIITPVMFANEKHPLQGIKEEMLGGVGDDAHYMTTPGFGTGLSVIKGGFAFKIRVYGFPIEQIQAKEKTLAQKVLAKL